MAKKMDKQEMMKELAMQQMIKENSRKNIPMHKQMKKSGKKGK